MPERYSGCPLIDDQDIVTRLARLETKVDNIQEDISELKGTHVTRREYNGLRNGVIGAFVLVATAIFDYFFQFIPHP